MDVGQKLADRADGSYCHSATLPVKRCVFKGFQRAQRRQFGKKSRKNNYNYNLPYDYGSVMHYGARSFITGTAAKNGELTIVPKDINYTETLGSSIIAFYDLLMMNIYYNCTDACKDEKTKCHNKGFVHPRNCSKCICPSGYGGQLCDERPAGCGEELNASETWKTLEDNLNGNETGPDGYSRCNYWIKYIIALIWSFCRFCSSFFVNTILTSHSNLVPVITYTNGMLYEDQEQTDGESDDESGDEEYYEGSDEYDNEDELEEDDDDEDSGSVVKLKYRYV
ncbi:astacin [Teladorsagia circumcincta]|uniref:Metalloendopeptidase n=1 Tax=Teladorsagia circumcincta TaxID=45464 RepID=A0A2G9U089_TELCI|nr:astacin [Teladorsagia circumcincta]